MFDILGHLPYYIYTVPREDWDQTMLICRLAWAFIGTGVHIKGYIFSMLRLRITLLQEANLIVLEVDFNRRFVLGEVMNIELCPLWEVSWKHFFFSEQFFQSRSFSEQEIKRGVTKVVSLVKNDSLFMPCTNNKEADHSVLQFQHDLMIMRLSHCGQRRLIRQLVDTPVCLLCLHIHQLSKNPAGTWRLYNLALTSCAHWELSYIAITTEQMAGCKISGMGFYLDNSRQKYTTFLQTEPSEHSL